MLRDARKRLNGPDRVSQRSPFGTELPIRNVRSSVAIGGKSENIWLNVSSSHFDPGRVKTPMREVDTSFLKKRILQFGGASVSVLASLHVRRNHFLISCSAREFSHGCAGRPARSRWCKSTTMKE
jgi:hypothetical protein